MPQPCESCRRTHSALPTYALPPTHHSLQQPKEASTNLSRRPPFPPSPVWPTRNPSSHWCLAHLNSQSQTIIAKRIILVHHFPGNNSGKRIWTASRLCHNVRPLIISGSARRVNYFLQQLCALPLCAYHILCNIYAANTLLF